VVRVPRPGTKHGHSVSDIFIRTPDYLSRMVDRELQDAVLAKVETIFASYGPDQLELVLGELASLEFVRKGGNIAAMTMEQTEVEIFLIIGLDEKGEIASREIRRFEELEIVRR
jgi:hypothetical protein